MRNKGPHKDRRGLREVKEGSAAGKTVVKANGRRGKRRSGGRG